MTATSTNRMVVAFIALAVAGGIALVVAFQHVWREPPVKTRAAATAPAVSKPAAAAQKQALLPAAQAEANAVAAALAGSSSPANDGVPAFDIARIEPTGEAVIAGRATPGATVELLRNGEPHDRAVADQSGQFTMIPPQLPHGTYDLTLRATQADGKQVMSKQSVPVVRAAAKADGSDTMATASIPAQASKRPGKIASAGQPQFAATGVLTDKGSPSAAGLPKVGTATVSRGDSLWRLSRQAYGAGTGYAAIYKANQAQIRNPDLIYPGQIFVLPTGEARP
ncbi:LysM peptidoglycan-binding domain-containing protein [Bradyrhizobium sp. LHD-71]|uniref:LysM peptidoglycan-binding domain-containing protein n=1 Tax=Bradyrhizobium sp. LHD-71 TaxID=3072141 RepID=UPI00280FF499|nr:LysM peptidoglycan-binding domain-containing protein [Bradyrhizobium sp. LHD-71]MDQ8726653.1 LysM peptidoglycan-binding domain-containing protein [Bradyrhizobium sp. LHD-71]